MTVLAIVALIALVAWIISNTSIDPRARKAVWIVAAVLAVLVVVLHYSGTTLLR